MTAASRLRERLRRPDILVMPGAADALNARLVEEAGFDAVYATGAGIANTLLGLPDLGLATMTEIVEQARRMTAAVEIPVVVDADTGYGNPLNVIRTVRELERAGAAAIQLEDQVSPKRCGHFSGKEVVPAEEMVRKIYAAREARRDSGLLLIARTDAIAVEGFDRAVDRARAYAAAGADVIFVEAPETEEQVAALPSLVPAPLLYNMTEGGRSPMKRAGDLAALGYRIALFPNTVLRAAMLAVREALSVLRADGSSARVLDRLETWEERQRVARLPEYQALERRFVREPIDTLTADEPTTGPRR
jgi:methylisocitrate lyase